MMHLIGCISLIIATSPNSVYLFFLILNFLPVGTKEFDQVLEELIGHIIRGLAIQRIINFLRAMGATTKLHSLAAVGVAVKGAVVCLSFFSLF